MDKLVKKFTTKFFVLKKYIIYFLVNFKRCGKIHPFFSYPHKMDQLENKRIKILELYALSTVWMTFFDAFWWG